MIFSLTSHTTSKAGGYRGRLAPAPTGALHLGNARTFVIAWVRTRVNNGRLVLRLEDLDHPKVRQNAAEEAYGDLLWLGLNWDDGPVAAMNKPFVYLESETYVQSRNIHLYKSALNALRHLNLCYPCICTRRDLETVQSAPNEGEDLLEKKYPGTCRGRFAGYAEAVAAAEGREPGWRFRIDDGEETVFVDGFFGEQRSRLSQWSGDFLVARGEKAGYQLAVVVDDHRMGVTEVVRGDDLLPSTHRQLALYKAFGWEPPSFYHVPLVVGPDGRRLAKRHGDTRLSVLRQAGLGPERVLGWLAWSCGWQDSYRKELSLADLLEKADCASIPNHHVVVEKEHLEWLGFDRSGGRA